MTDPTQIFDKVPKDVPLWAKGLMVVFVSFAVSFGTVYMVSRDEIKDYMKNRQAIDELAAKNAAAVSASRITSEDNTLQSILGLVHTNTKQISDLSAALSQSQTNNFQLAEKVSAIEKELILNQTELTKCKDDLKKCKL